MQDEYDFSAANKNPYAEQLKKSGTIRRDAESVDCFKALAEETGMPHQSLINLYLKEDCVRPKRRLNLGWQQ